MTSHLIIPDSHAHFQHNNDRATWLGNFIADVKPDVVVHIGDSADMPSLSGYDKGKKCFQGRTYSADIDAHLSFQDRLWEPIYRSKRKLPRSVFCIGNHEQRIARAIQSSPELEGAIGYKDLNLERWYDEVVDYEGNAPGFIEIDGIAYAHYFVSGILGKPVGGVSPANALIAKKHSSVTCGHSHLADWACTKDMHGQWIMAAFAGCYIDYSVDWAGPMSDTWWKGVLYKTNVENGSYDPHFVSLDYIKKTYGRPKGANGNGN